MREFTELTPIKAIVIEPQRHIAPPKKVEGLTRVRIMLAGISEKT